MAVPKLRLPGYHDAWKAITLGDKMSYKNGVNASRNAFRSEGYKCIGVSDVYKCVPITDQAIIGTVALNQKEAERYIVNYGDLLFQRSSETQEDIGHVSAYIGAGNVVFNGFVICGKPTEPFYNPVFMHYELQTSRVRSETVRLGAGAQHYNIGQESLSKIGVYVPTITEQDKIADFITTIDKMISACQDEIENLVQQKVSVVQKIFSLDIRFKRADGTGFPEWKSTILTEVLSEYKDTCEKDGTFEHVSLTKEGVVSKTDRYDREFLVTNENKKYRITHYNDICYNPANLKFGVICRNRYGSGIFSPIYVTFKVKSGYSPVFIELLVTRHGFIKRALKFQQGTVYERMAVSPEDLLSMREKIPCLEEQQLIADFLFEYDTAIQAAKDELANWQELKKGLLQQMFI